MVAIKPISRRTTGYSYREFNRNKQLRRLLAVAFLRWLLTAALAASTYGVLWAYSRGAMVSNEKKKFNTLILGLSILLGLNIASSLKAMVAELRWLVLSLREWSPRETDLILQSENISRLIQLGWVSRSVWIRSYVLIWVVINVASQIAVAMLGLTYNVNGAEGRTITRPGTVAIPDISKIQTGKVLSTGTQALSALRYTANSYGLVALAYGYGTLDALPSPGTLFDPDSDLMYCGDSYCKYVFYETTPPELPWYSSVATDRSITTNSTCASWRVVAGGDGTLSIITLGDEYHTAIYIPSINGADQTTFMVSPDVDLGPTWSRVLAFEASKTDPWFYDCNVTIGEVVNAKLPVHSLGANVSSMAAPAIALQGYGASTFGVNSTGVKKYQFQSYPAESVYGNTQNGNNNGMALLMSRFAIGVVAVTAQANTNILAPGRLPLKGIQLDINHWYYVHMILGLTVGLQLLLALGSILAANRVLVRDHSHLGMAALLRPAIETISQDAVMASGSEILELLGPDARLTYAPGVSGVHLVQTNY